MSHCQLYVISPPVIKDAEAFARQLDAVFAAGEVAAFQLRLKAETDPETGEAPPAPDSVWRAVAPPLRDVCRTRGVSFILNDRADLVEGLDADGVHLGQADGDARQARMNLGKDRLIGVTCHNSRHLAMQAGEAGADYVAFGAFFGTATKPVKYKAEPDLLTWWSELFELPAVAIGGITVDNVQHLVDAGADYVAVASGVWGHELGPEAAVAAFTHKLRGA